MALEPLSMETANPVLEIKRIRIRSVFLLAFFFHLLVGLIIGIFLVGALQVILVFGMEEILPQAIRDIGNPTTTMLVILSLSALAMGLIGAIAWSFLVLLYNVIAGFVRGIQLEIGTRGGKKGGDTVDG